VVKNDILFFSTSENKISNIINDRMVGNAGKHKKLIRKSVSAFYMNGQQMMSKVPASEFSNKEKDYLDFAQENFKDAYLKSSKIKGDKMLSEIIINTSESQGNSLKLILNFVEALAN